MSHTLTLDPSLLVSGLTLQGSEAHQEKTDEAVRASMQQLEALLEMLVNTEESTTKGSKSKSSKVNVMENILNRFAPLLSKYMQEDPTKASQLMGSLASLMNAHANGNEEDMQQILSTLQPIMIQFLVKHPEDQMSVIKSFAPLIRESVGPSVLPRFKEAHKGIKALTAALNGPNSEAVSKEVLDAATHLFNTKPEVANDLVNEMIPALEVLYKKDPAKMEGFLTQFLPLLSMIALRNPAKAKEVAANFQKGDLLAKLYNLPKEKSKAALALMNEAFTAISANREADLEGFVSGMKQIVIGSTDADAIVSGTKETLGDYKDAGTNNSPNFNSLIGLAMFFLQMFQQAVTKFQSDQSELQLTVGNAMMKSAQVSQQNLDNEVAQEEAEQAAAANRPWYDIFITIVVSVVGAVISGLTMGIGACLVAVAVGAFMTSPLFNMAVKAIAEDYAKAHEQEYYQEYIHEGKSPAQAKQLAKEKAEHIGDIIGKVVMCVVIMVVSCGLGGITAGAEEGAEEAGEAIAESAAEEGFDSASEASEGEVGQLGSLNADQEEDAFATEEVNSASKASKWGWTSKGTFALAASQGLNSLASSNIWMDCLMAHPDWAKKHQDLVIILDVIAEVLTVIASIGCNIKAFSTRLANGLTPDLKVLCSKAGYILGGGLMIQGASEGYNCSQGIMQANYLSELANTLEQVGQYEQALATFTTNAEVMQDTAKMNNDSASPITKGVGQEMNALEDLAGNTWATTSRIL